jgi:hypothetical protein
LVKRGGAEDDDDAPDAVVDRYIYYIERERDIPLTRAMRARKATRMHSTLHASLPPLRAPAAAAPTTGLRRRRRRRTKMTELSQATGNKNQPTTEVGLDEGEWSKRGGTIDFV